MYIARTYMYIHIYVFFWWVNADKTTLSGALYICAVHNSMMQTIWRITACFVFLVTVTGHTSATTHTPTVTPECGYGGSVDQGSDNTSVHGCNHGNNPTNRVDHRDIRVPNSLSRNLMSHFWNVAQRSNVTTPSAEETFGIFRTGNDSFYLDLGRVCHVIITHVYQLTPTPGKIYFYRLCK
jgi:hypothetical protein